MLFKSNASVLAVSLIALCISVLSLTTERHRAFAQDRVNLSPEQSRTLDALEGAFTSIANAVEPCVVQIRTEAERPKFRGDANPPDGGDENANPTNPFGDMFPQWRFGTPPQVIPRGGGTGSGVIGRIDGNTVYILTNAHVVQGSGKITVQFQDGREVTGANVSVRGLDTKNDLAVVKAVLDKPLDPRYQAQLGDSSKLHVGQWAVAIGSPFGLASSFTVGVISALKRAQVIQDTPYTDLIQTDASINPGNSGGALVNSHGEVIGINTAIATGMARTSSGVGFAIPINKAKRIMEQLITQGKAVYGYIGVKVGDLTPELQQLAKTHNGVFVHEVTPDSPGARAGIHPEDVIAEFDGKPVNSKDELVEMASGTAPGTKVQLKVVRYGDVKMITLTLGELPQVAEAGPGGAAPTPDKAHRAGQIGITRYETLTPELLQRLKLPAGLKGVLVEAVAPDSPAAKEGEGLMPRDIIERVNGQAVTDVQTFDRILDGLKEKDLIFLRVIRIDVDGSRSGMTLGIDPQQ